MWRIDEMAADLRDRIPEIGEAIGSRNASHMGYDSIDSGLVWTTVVEDLRPLRRVIRRALREAGEAIEPPDRP